MNLQVFRCVYCGNQVVRVQTTSGYWLWIDADPHPRGTLTIDRDGLVKVVSAREGGIVKHRPHRATCEAHPSAPCGKAPANPKK